ncbi:HlyD family efflux transporter periplasmic adaptor subunit [Hymenobacter frigidus]|nr:HlyD family efflux transporter periplasmic adaptor subunit [Hymenobacter frigidus]
MPPENYLHSEIQEIMVTKPSFVLKSGNFLIAGLLLILLAFTAWFKYPEFITTEVSLVTQTPVDSLVAPDGNRGAVLLVPNGTFVRRGAALVAWQDADRTDYGQARKLNQLLSILPAAGLPATELARLLRPIRLAQLGRLQPVYQRLLAASANGTPLSAKLLAASRAQLVQWEQAAVGVASQDGIVQTSYPVRAAAAAIPAGRAVVCLLPRQSIYLALGTISREQYATVRPGQRVLLQMHELGTASLTGSVLEVAPLARHQQHQVVIQLASTNRERLYPSFSGSARIMLHQQSLLAKFLGR